MTTGLSRVFAHGAETGRAMQDCRRLRIHNCFSLRVVLCPIYDASGLFPAFPSAALTSSCLVPNFNSMSIYAPLDCRFRINAGSLLTRSLPRAEAVID